MQRSDVENVRCAEGNDSGALPRTLPRRRYGCEKLVPGDFAGECGEVQQMKTELC